MLRFVPPQLMLTAILLFCLSGSLGRALPNELPAALAASGMVLVPAGVYRPLFAGPTEPREIPVPAFYLDRLAVTVTEYLEFVRANPSWRRSKVKPLFADSSYLKNWVADLDPGQTTPSNAPVTYVSWFAAKAYAQWKGKRLPTLAEWEYAANASATRADGENDPGFRQEVLRWYTTLGADLAPVGLGRPNLWGVQDLHGLVWEWVLDFNSAMVSADSRGDNGGAESGLFCGSGSQGARNVANYPAFMRVGFRSSLTANYCIHNLGFRCAKDL
jgi:formylglycine-generating enzyme required for sulfatase activity